MTEHPSPRTSLPATLTRSGPDARAHAGAWLMRIPLPIPSASASASETRRSTAGPGGTDYRPDSRASRDEVRPLRACLGTVGTGPNHRQPVHGRPVLFTPSERTLDLLHRRFIAVRHNENSRLLLETSFLELRLQLCIHRAITERVPENEPVVRLRQRFFENPVRDIERKLLLVRGLVPLVREDNDGPKPCRTVREIVEREAAGPSVTTTTTTRAATSSSEASARSNSGAGWQPDTTSSRSPTVAVSFYGRSHSR